MADYPSITWSESGVPKSELFGDYYFSLKGAVNERRTVFLEGNNLPANWTDHTTFNIGETGFGTGLSFLLTAQLWQNTKSLKDHLHYYSFEKYPLTPAQWKQAAAAWPELENLHPLLMKVIGDLKKGWNTLFFSPQITLHLFIGDVCEGLKSLQAKVNCWYLDGFSPAKNPDMWSDELLGLVASHTQPKGTIATYTAMGRLQRTLKSLGFAVTKQKGFAGKRERICAVAVGVPFMDSADLINTPPTYKQNEEGIFQGE